MLSNETGSTFVAGLIFEPLTTLDPHTGERRPDLATWTISGDGQALAYGLDMDAVLKKGALGEGTKVVAHHPPASWAYPDPTTLDSYPYDPAKAEQLLAQAGFARGPDGIYVRGSQPLAFTISTGEQNATWRAMAQIAVDQYRAIGVKVAVELMPFSALLDKFGTGNADAAILNWVLGEDPDPFMIWHSTRVPDLARKIPGFNGGGFTAPGLDQVIESARTPANGDCSQAARKKSYETFNCILNEEPYNFGFASNRFVIASKGFRGLDPGTFAVFSGVEKWWFKR